MPLVILVQVRFLYYYFQDNFGSLNSPFLRTINDIFLSVGGFLGGCRDIGHVASRIGFRNGNTASLFARQQVRQKSFLKLRRAEFYDGRDSECHASR